MNTELQNFSPLSRIWVYQSSRPFDSAEQTQIDAELKAFAKQWAAHNIQLKATGFVAEGRIVILAVDETNAGASGCSIDTSVHFIQSLEKKYHCALFDRTIVNYFSDKGVETVHLSELSALYQKALIQDDTLVIDPLVQNKSDFETGFKIPLGKSWLHNFTTP